VRTSRLFYLYVFSFFHYLLDCKTRKTIDLLGDAPYLPEATWLYNRAKSFRDV
jgi:hypothetical protein